MTFFSWHTFSASGYNTKYLKDIDFDNVYMTAYFRRIDARRKKQVSGNREV